MTTPIRLVFADTGFAGRLVDWCRDVLWIVLEIMRNPVGERGFVVRRRRWVAERTLAWPTSYRRLARDYERDPVVFEALIRWAAISQMVADSPGGPARRQQRRTFNTPD